MAVIFKLEKKIIIEGEIIALSGLMIGGSNTAMGIGGPDKVVIRNPVTRLPYIPGSTLKGKMRSLLEVSHGHLGGSNGKVKYGPSQDPTHSTTKLFGSADKNHQIPSRIIFRDCPLTNPGDLSNTDMQYTESKTEVVIDRVTSVASPRTFERVPEGAKFKFQIILNIFSSDSISESEALSLITEGLKLIEDDFIGGGGSRGSGRIKFGIKKVIERPAAYYQTDDKSLQKTRPELIPEGMNA
jgi:CRISPR-associated protein Csm3